MSCLKASAAADAVYGPGFKDLNEDKQKYHVWNAPYTAAVTGEDVADIIDKLRSVYQKGHADKVVAPVADTKDEAPAAAAGAEHAVSVLFIGTQFSILYTSMYSPA